MRLVNHYQSFGCCAGNYGDISGGYSQINVHTLHSMTRRCCERKIKPNDSDCGYKVEMMQMALGL